MHCVRHLTSEFDHLFKFTLHNFIHAATQLTHRKNKTHASFVFNRYKLFDILFMPMQAYCCSSSTCTAIYFFDTLFALSSFALSHVFPLAYHKNQVVYCTLELFFCIYL